jgi:deoxyribodipyrimidine photo-lyase
LYVREPEIIKAKDYSHFHQYRIQESVKELKANLKKIGIPLYTTYQGIQETLDHIQKHYHIAKLYAHEETGNAISYTRDKNIIQYCKKHNISFTEYPNNGIVRRLESRDIRDTIRKKRMLDTIITNPLPQTYRHIHTDLEKYSRRTFEHFTKATKPLTRTSDFDIP